VARFEQLRIMKEVESLLWESPPVSEDGLGITGSSGWSFERAGRAGSLKETRGLGADPYGQVSVAIWERIYLQTHPPFRMMGQEQLSALSASSLVCSARHV
jgi:hypothetical protein